MGTEVKPKIKVGISIDGNKLNLKDLSVEDKKYIINDLKELLVELENIKTAVKEKEQVGV